MSDQTSNESEQTEQIDKSEQTGTTRPEPKADPPTPPPTEPPPEEEIVQAPGEGYPDGEYPESGIFGYITEEPVATDEG